MCLHSITHYINILIMTVTRGKLFVSSVVSISFIIKGAGEFISLFYCLEQDHIDHI